MLVLPTAAAFEHPERAVANAVAHFSSIGATARGLGVLGRADAMSQDMAAEVRHARFLYLTGGSALHLRSVLKDSLVWESLSAAWRDGAVLAGSSAGAMVFCDPMVDPRGGAFTIGLGLIDGVTVIPHHDQWSHDRIRRTVQLAPRGIVLAGIDEGSALVRDRGGPWRAAGNVTIYLDGEHRNLDALPE